MKAIAAVLCLLASLQALLAFQAGLGPLLNHRLRVPAGRGNWLCFQVARTGPVALDGNFRASGGNGNDIEAAIGQEEEAINWSNGHESQLLWYTESKRTAGSFRVDLEPGGRYCVAFSNRFSAVSDKVVSVNADLVRR